MPRSRVPVHRRLGRQLEDLGDHALHVTLNRRAWTILRIELGKRLRRRWRDSRWRRGMARLRAWFRRSHA